MDETAEMDKRDKDKKIIDAFGILKVNCKVRWARDIRLVYLSAVRRIKRE